MKKLSLSFIVVLALYLSGCIYLRLPHGDTMFNHSIEKPFYGLIGKEVKLLRSVKVYDDVFLYGLDEREADSVMDVGDPPSLFFDPYGNKFSMNFYDLPDELPKGTIIKFDSFWVHKDYVFFMPYNIRYTAWFRAPSLNLPEHVRFLYVWGRGRYLHRAPWEDNKVPESRYVGASGKGYNPE